MKKLEKLSKYALEGSQFVKFRAGAGPTPGELGCLGENTSFSYGSNWRDDDSNNCCCKTTLYDLDAALAGGGPNGGNQPGGQFDRAILVRIYPSFAALTDPNTLTDFNNTFTYS